MLCVIAYCAKDKDTTVRLANWIAELGGVGNHDCILGVHTDTDTTGIYDVLAGAFRRVGSFLIDEEATIYPFIANQMWKRCAQHVADGIDEPQPWFWLEPDAVPLTPNWLDAIEAEYKAVNKPFLLDKVVTPTSVHNSGVGVYPARVRDYTTQLWNLANIPWDVFFKEDFTPHTHHTGLIHDKFYAKWDDPTSGPPVFPDAQSLDIIEPRAVLFHRNKDGSLIDRLRERGGMSKTPIQEVIESMKPGAFPNRLGLPDRSEPSEIELLKSRIEALEVIVFPARNGAAASAPVQAGDKGVSCVSPPSLKPPRLRRKATKKDTRTPEEIQAAKDRMAKARAGRKLVAA